MKIFGFQIKRQEEAPLPSFVPAQPEADDGAVVIQSGGIFGVYVDIDGTIRGESELVNKYREIAEHPEVESAVDDVINESIVIDDVEDLVQIDLDSATINGQKLPPRVAKIIEEEFEESLSMLGFKSNPYETFKRWYVDGRIYFHAVIDPKRPQLGIQELRYIDPRKIRKIRETKKVKDPASNIAVVQTENEYYVYNDKGFNSSSYGAGGSSSTAGISSGIRIAKDSIIQCTSGISSSGGDMILSYLHSAIKPVNMLRSMEDSLVIYRISRAAERRVFYVDVGNMPKMKAEQYMRDTMVKFKNKVVYDSDTGSIRSDRKFSTMTEDFWLPRREGGKGTEITTLPAGCLAMDTKVSLLDGRELTINEISEELNKGISLWTYSCDPVTGKIEPGLISWAGVTQESAKVMKITLDNGENIVCTLDHKFPVYGKGFVRADELNINESMVPLYRKKEPLHNGNNPEYEQIFNNETKEWEFTHRLVADKLKGTFVNDWIFDNSNVNEKKYVRHHIDHNKFNNSPENLCFMGFHDHRIYHQSYGFSEENQKKGTEASRLRMENMKTNSPEKYIEYCEYLSKKTKQFWESLSDEEYKIQCEKQKNNIINYFENLSDEDRKTRSEISRKNFKKGSIKSHFLLANNPVFREKKISKQKKTWYENGNSEKYTERFVEYNKIKWNINGDQTREEHKTLQKINIDNEIVLRIIDCVKGKTTHQVTIHDVVDYLNSDEFCVKRFKELNSSKRKINHSDVDSGFNYNILKKCIKDFGYSNWKDFRVKESLHNHRIVSIEYLDKEIQVGTLTIDQEELIHNHHTFALSAGIFTKNSNLGQIEDVLYFKKNLYRSLKIPVTRIDPDAMFNYGRTNELTRDEIKFAKFITRLRSKFATLFTKILERQLVLKGIMSIEEFNSMADKIKYNFAKDNYFEEIKQAEIYTERLNVLNAVVPFIGRFFSNKWVQQNVLHQTEEEMEQIREEIIEEMSDPLFVPPQEEESQQARGMAPPPSPGQDNQPQQ